MSLTILNLNKSYGLNSEKLSILKNLNVKISKSEIVAIVGASGSGKSTFLSLIAGLDKIDDGDILINERSIKKLTKNEITQFRAENIAFIFQQFHLVSHLNAYENLTLPLEILNKKFTKEFVLKSLDEVGLLDRKNHLPSQLSGGECQRLAIARGLITEPSLLLADEPSGNLDVATGAKVMDLFFEQVRKLKTTTILVTHDINLARKCDRILNLKNGYLESV